MNFNDVLKNLRGGLEVQGERVYGNITDAWDAFTNLNSLSLPNVNIKNLFGSIAQMTSTFSDAGSGDTTQTNVLSGLEHIWSNNNTGLNIQNLNDLLNHKKHSDDPLRNGIDAAPSFSTAKIEPFVMTAPDGTKITSQGADAVTIKPNNTSPDIKEFVTEFQGMDPVSQQDYYGAVVDTSDADRLNFQTPDWSYADFINERAIFQKSLQNPVGEQGWFYFKIFFNFDTQYGLFGGLLNDPDPMMATNSAYKYLRACESLGQYYKTNDRQVALMKFAKILSYISTYAPWFFKSIKNLNQANVPVINDFTKERSIEIECSNDAIDMRLNTLLDLYKFACYDEIDQKEIVPDNLRKFDMTVMVFQAPIKYFHTSFRTTSGTKYNYKGTSVNPVTGFSDVMSFKMFTFINCEIDRESLGNMIPGSMNNEKPFNMGGGSIKIFYDRVYTHTMNEFMHLMFGNDGLYYDGSASTSRLQGVNETQYRLQTEHQKARVRDIKHAYDDTQKPENNDNMIYKNIVDASEALCNSNMRALGFNSLGNFAGNNKDLQFERSNRGVSRSEYYDLKLKMLKNDPEILQEALSGVSSGVNDMITELIESYNKMKSSIRATWTSNPKTLMTDKNGRLIGDTSDGVQGMTSTFERNMYWRNKINAMKDGIVAPESLITRYEGQQYDYLNFTHNGYSDNTINTTAKGKVKYDMPGTDYWLRKLNALNDGNVSPETLEQRYSNQEYDTTNYTKNYRDEGQAATQLTTDKFGRLTESSGTNYWLEKIRLLKDGTLKSNTPELNITNEHSGDYITPIDNEKLQDIHDGVIPKEHGKFNNDNFINEKLQSTHDGVIPKEHGEYNNERFISDKLQSTHDGSIEKKSPKVVVKNEPTIERGTDIYENIRGEKLRELKEGVIEKHEPPIVVTNNITHVEPTPVKVENIRKDTGIHDPYSGEYLQQKIAEMNDGIVAPENLVSNSYRVPMPKEDN